MTPHSKFEWSNSLIIMDSGFFQSRTNMFRVFALKLTREVWAVQLDQVWILSSRLTSHTAAGTARLRNVGIAKCSSALLLLVIHSRFINLDFSQSPMIIRVMLQKKINLNSYEILILRKNVIFNNNSADPFRALIRLGGMLNYLKLH